MGAWQAVFLVSALFGLSLIGIIIGWLDWERGKPEGKGRLFLDQEMALAAIAGPALAALVSAFGAYVFIDRSVLTSVAFGGAALLVTYMTLWLCLRRS